ncbi:MAG: PEP/pyruvate-binding domain-containing protein [Candidatus Micrarchaeota archaeon]
MGHSHNYIRHFSKLGRGDVAIAGGKGASLGEMFSHGIAVPHGFTVITPAFDAFIELNQLDERIKAALFEVNQKESASVEKASETIRKLIEEGDMPKDVEDAIVTEFNAMASQFVAVRSSATAEDGSTASWAGELESYTNVTEEDLVEKVQTCWASLFTPRAIFYRFEKNMQHKLVSVGVVVQKMVDSAVSGVAFSVNPVTKNYDQIIIEAGLGLGESVVAGIITPDNYLVNKKEEYIEDITVNSQETMIDKVDGVSTTIDVPLELRESQKLTGQQIIELAKMVKHIEKHYGFPVDIEWAYDKNDKKLYIVQSRPITTL